MNQWLRLRRFAIAMVGFITLLFAAAAVASAYFELPGVIILMLGFAAGFATGSLIGMLFVQGAINSVLGTQRPSTLDDIVRSRRRL